MVDVVTEMEAICCAADLAAHTLSSKGIDIDGVPFDLGEDSKMYFESGIAAVLRTIGDYSSIRSDEESQVILKHYKTFATERQDILADVEGKKLGKYIAGVIYQRRAPEDDTNYRDRIITALRILSDDSRCLFTIGAPRSSIYNTAIETYEILIKGG